MPKPQRSVTSKKPKLLSGGNPQIAKADGDAPVRAYIAAMPGWKRAIGKKLDALIARTVPGVQRSVKWNSPMYSLEGRGIFVSFHTFTNYVKVTFFHGASLKPLPPGPSKDKNTRYLDIREDGFDEAQLADWLTQAAALPGWIPGKPLAPATRSNADWRAGTLERMRELIFEADPDMIEERKWKKPSNPAGVPVWCHHGIVCTGETYAKAVKLTFMHGASLPDPSGLFNASLDGNARRAIDIHEGETVNARAFKALIKAAVAHNRVHLSSR